MKRHVFAIVLLTSVLFGARNASASPIYFNGFETDTSGWTAFGGAFNATRVASGTGGVTSASGSFHAVNSASGSAGNWGGYNFGAGNAVPTAFQEYTTGVNIYLDVNGGWANDTRFDFSSAINNAAGTHLQDYIFNCGFYNDGIGPGANTNRYVCSTSNNSQPGSAFAQNPARDPFAISSTGWYDFQTHFYNNGGFLAADLSIFDASNVLQHAWTITTSTAIGGVGGNRYGWFDFNQFGSLAFDNTRLDTAALAAVPEPATLSLLGLGLGLAGSAFKRRRKVKSAR